MAEDRIREAADALAEAARRLLVDPPAHDCRGPACLLCQGLDDALSAYYEVVVYAQETEHG